MEKTAFELKGRVEAVLISPPFGQIPSETFGFGSVASVEVPKIQLVQGYGIRGDRHAGARLMDVRENEMRSLKFQKGHQIANMREFSAISLSELEEIGSNLHLPQALPFGSLGENLIVSGIPEFSKLPVSTLLFFRRDTQVIRTAVLAIWAENGPCKGPGEVLQTHFSDEPDLASRFPKAAKGLRGVVGFVYCSGNIHKGDEVIAKIPHQRMYLPA